MNKGLVILRQVLFKIKKSLKNLEVSNKNLIFAPENNRASEYRVGLQFRREGFRGPFSFVYLGYYPIHYGLEIHSKYSRL